MFPRWKNRPAKLRPRPARLAFERLEDRALLAGNIAARISGGTLHLTGDAQSNQVLVERIGPSSVQLTSLDGTTTINNSSSVVLNGFTKGINASLGNGDDELLFAGAADSLFRVHGNVFVNLGNGNDSVGFANFHTTQSLHINSGAGSDQVNAAVDVVEEGADTGFGLRVGKNTLIIDSSGSDSITLENSQFAGTFVLNAGTQDDRVDLRNNAFGKVTLLHGSQGFDRLNNVANQFQRRPLIISFESRTAISGPTAASDTATVAEGETVRIDVASNDTSTGAALDLDSIVITQTPANGTATANADGSVTYVHNGSDTTSDAFRYTIADVNGNVSAAALVSITVTPVNDPPAIGAVADLTTNVNVATGPINVSLSDDLTAAASIGLTAASSNTSLVPNANIAIAGTGSNRTVIVTPAANLTGAATITLTATDSGGLSSTETFVVTVNAAPTISPVADVTTNVNTATSPLSVTLGDDITAAAILVLSATSSNSSLIPNANIALAGSGASRTAVVTPAANLSGSSTITLTVTDANGLSATETFVVTVNAAPTISNVADVTISEDAQAGPLSVTIGDDLTAAAALQVSATSSNTTLIPNANIQLGGSGTARTALITPVGNASGSSTITLTVTDGNGLTATDTFIVTVDPVNDAPTISAVADATVNSNATLGPIAVTLGDQETPLASLALSATSSNQAIVQDSGITLGGSAGDRTVLVTPVANASGTATITLTVTDSNNLTTTETFVVTVNAAPTISNVADLTVNQDTQAGPIDVTVGDTETPLTALTLTATSSNQAVIENSGIALGGSGAARTVLITPVANAAGSSTITLTLTDAGGASVTETFVITVNGDPTIADVADVSINEDTQAGPISVSIGDAETPAANLVLVATSSNQAVIQDSGITLGGSGGARTVLITPVANASGTATITLTTTDAGGASATDTFVVTVNPVNDPPAAIDDEFTVDANMFLTVDASGDILLNDEDGGDGGSLSVSALAGAGATVGTPFVSTYGTFTVNANGSFTYDLDETVAAVDALMAGQELFDEIGYTVSDGVDVDTGLLRIRIRGANS